MKSVAEEFKIEKNKEIVRPIYLYGIQYDEVANKWLYYTNWNEEILWEGALYQPYVITHGAVKETLSGKVEKVSLTIGNVDRNLQYYLENYKGLKDRKVVITTVFYEALDNPNCYDRNEYRVESSTSDQRTVLLTLGSSLDVLNVKLPRRYFFRSYCQFRFKGKDCGYSGGETWCNKTFQRCEELGNIRRFGGFPATPMKRRLSLR